MSVENLFTVPDALQKSGLALDKFQARIVLSIFSIGALIASLLTGRIADRFGRKKVLMVNNFGFALGIGFFSFARNYPQMLIGRFFIGYSSGVAGVVVPMYLSEISTDCIRGLLGAFHQFSIVFGIFFSLSLAVPLGTNALWRWYFGISFVPCVLQLVLLVACPESPAYEMLRGKVSRCEISLYRLRPLHWDVAEEREVIDLAIQAAKSLGDSYSVFSLVKLPVARNSLLLCVFMHAIQQFSGIDVIMLFSKDWFTGSGAALEKYITVIQGITAIFGTLLSIYLIERVGRRILTLASSLGCAISLTAVTVVLLSDGKGLFLLVPFLGFVVSFAIGLGPVTWIIINDIFPPNSRAAAVSVAVSVNWLSKFILLTLSGPLMSGLKNFSFVPFALVLYLFSGYALRNLKETKGRPVGYL